ncbi:hypothetical protein, partial [Streptomyces sp. NPDC005784]|uniref:hypothetical protein n=1 Tax=Streptomyces sp. NPDC005784 TaxID=3364731 RepID=UPI0036C63C07
TASPACREAPEPDNLPSSTTSQPSTRRTPSQSFLGWLPGLEATVVILCNNEETNLDALLRQLIPTMLDS